jgi:hypothetical protein
VRVWARGVVGEGRSEGEGVGEVVMGEVVMGEVVMGEVVMGEVVMGEAWARV